MDKNTWVGFLLIAGILVGFSLMSRPSKEELARRQHVNDSIAYVQQLEAESLRLQDSLNTAMAEPETLDSAQLADRLQQTYGAFAAAAVGSNEDYILENEHVRLHFSTLGGRLSKAELKDYHRYNDSVAPLCLFEPDEQELSFTLVTNNNRIITTNNLYFQPLNGHNHNQLIMRLTTDLEDSYLDFVYDLNDDYMLGMHIVANNMQHVLAQNVSSLEMQWHQLIPQQERGRKFEERYAQLQYMLVGGDMEKLSEQKPDQEKESGRIRWIAYKDQFFSTVLIADDAFASSVLESTPMPKHSGYIKEYKTTANINLDLTGQTATGLRYYLGPNHYNTLKAYDADAADGEHLYLKELVPLGWKIVSWINKALVIPMFDLFTSWGLHIGLVILLMTIVIKLIILPFVFASYKSSAKMRVLKPQLDEINTKYPPEKMQERQQATMQLYQRAGVSPMSGCLPMLFQFPVLMAMFWFLPTAIELRGKSLLWAEDLSTYDAIWSWGFNIPLLGDHLSLFCLLMTAVNIIYTYITMQSQATDPNMKMMKYMMYAMPVMFLFIFNDYAAGLSYYYLVSLFFTIAQTMIFRWAIDDEKVLAEMEKNAKKKQGKPKSRFVERLEQMQREQQRLAREQAKANQRRR